VQCASDICLSLCLSDVCLSVAYIGPKSRTERPIKTKIGTEVAHVTHDSDTTFKVKGQRSTCGGGAYCGGLPHSLFIQLYTALATLHRILGSVQSGANTANTPGTAFVTRNVCSMSLNYSVTMVQEPQKLSLISQCILVY